MRPFRSLSGGAGKARYFGRSSSASVPLSLASWSRSSELDPPLTFLLALTWNDKVEGVLCPGENVLGLEDPGTMPSLNSYGRGDLSRIDEEWLSSRPFDDMANRLTEEVMKALLMYEF